MNVTDRLDQLIAEATELRRRAHPDTIVDTDGHVWTWKSGNLYTRPRPDLYPIDEWRSEVGHMALPHHMIQTA